ncbi:TspO/MBR family protein [Spongiactinospora sp. TRM90649]|uniref:TspO/MBR family protein n=1 Tax=Spongiactinospora sp. TRM90649 TaxID=3031114 RepID=UPI0023F77C7F|nr:TspO/MBR family protein [Spongiactinospora sp. TRM90649]MDF5753047.1 tryptophan-rich sensory protein [Spongiactinospora sp. TRM90649]
MRARGKRTTKKTFLLTALATGAAALAGSLGTTPRTAWYQGLRKPSWQPPSRAFPLVWTPLYGLIAYGGARALDGARDAERAGLARALAANLVLNAAWPALFFRARSPRLALAEITLLNASNAALVRRAARSDRTAGALLLPYAAWTAFATALNASIARRNA